MNFTELITVPNSTLVLVGLMYARDFLRWLAPKTETKLDDQILAAEEQAVNWALAMAPNFWAVVEWAGKVAADSGGKLDSLKKATDFVTALRNAYRTQYGSEIPKKAEEVAKTVAAGLSAGAKLGSVVNPSTLPARWTSPSTRMDSRSEGIAGIHPLVSLGTGSVGRGAWNGRGGYDTRKKKTHSSWKRTWKDGKKQF
jgi:hypothetical protein